MEAAITLPLDYPWRSSPPGLPHRRIRLAWESPWVFSSSAAPIPVEGGRGIAEKALRGRELEAALAVGKAMGAASFGPD